MTALGGVRRFIVIDRLHSDPNQMTDLLIDGTIYPFSARIIERGTVKGEKQKELYIDLGAAHGVREGTHFDVYVIGSIGGKETRQEIGRLKVKEVKGDEVSLCKVTSGSKEVKAALDSNQQLLIISTD